MFHLLSLYTFVNIDDARPVPVTTLALPSQENVSPSAKYWVIFVQDESGQYRVLERVPITQRNFVLAGLAPGQHSIRITDDLNQVSVTRDISVAVPPTTGTVCTYIVYDCWILIFLSTT